MIDNQDHPQHPDYEHDYPDHTQSPDWEHGDEPPCNTSANPTFYDVVDQARASRRGFLVGGLAAAVSGVFGVGLSTRGALASSSSAESLLGFTAVPVDATDQVVVPEGYKVQVLGAWGEPILGDMPAFDIANTGEEQARQIGQHHDGMHFFPIDGSSEDGLLVVNHEYVETRFMFPEYAGQEVNTWEVLVDGDGTRPADHVLKEMNAHGVSIYRTRRGADGWEIVPTRSIAGSPR
jgi:uncharacterized protein